MVQAASLMGWTQAEADPSACRQTQTHTAQPATLLGEGLWGLWGQKQDRNVIGTLPTSVASHPPAFPAPFIQLLARGASSEQGSPSCLAVPLVGGCGAGVHIFTHESKQMQISDLSSLCLIGAEFIFHSEKCLSGMIYNPSGSVGVGN